MYKNIRKELFKVIFGLVNSHKTYSIFNKNCVVGEFSTLKCEHTNSDFYLYICISEILKTRSTIIDKQLYCGFVRKFGKVISIEKLVFDVNISFIVVDIYIYFQH